MKGLPARPTVAQGGAVGLALAPQLPSRWRTNARRRCAASTAPSLARASHRLGCALRMPCQLRCWRVCLPRAFARGCARCARATATCTSLLLISNAIALRCRRRRLVGRALDPISVTYQNEALAGMNFVVQPRRRPNLRRTQVPTASPTAHAPNATSHAAKRPSALVHCATGHLHPL